MWRRRALTGNVGEDGGAEVHFADAQVGHERGERVVGDLGLGGADDAEQRALAGVRHADNSDVRDQLQFQVDPELLADHALLRHLRRAATGDPKKLNLRASRSRYPASSAGVEAPSMEYNEYMTSLLRTPSEGHS